ncbi:hypothetical protein AKI39_17500 [Bordetella sp. H567]|uniref:pentapeptide repeat-containing protein n=1 Tax=Bordetella sp. H567 TaxID=1697043 RepID=UPI00081C2F95|nr:pentapeptide repeat-containing protein [Bordetella sp. H567]AOB32126.1 hypothetical protein AKI39_17500 [Bordetella sp. H567]
MPGSIQPANIGIGPADPPPAPHSATGAPPGHVAQAVEFLFQATELGETGRQALKQWTTWTAYVATLTDADPHLAQLPGWNVVLPIDQAATADNLRRLLLRAGEPPGVAREAAQAFCARPPFPRATDAAAYRQACLEWLGGQLPAHALAFEALPDWTRTVALYAANLVGRDCRGMPGLRGLDLRYLCATHANFGGCDLGGCDFSKADVRGTDFSRADITDARFDDDATLLQVARENRSVPPIALGDTRHVYRNGRTCSDHGSTQVFDDDEILFVEPLAWRGEVDDIAIGRTHDGRNVVQQQSTRGCTAASTAMLILDQGFDFDPDQLRYRNMAIDERLHGDIRRAGLQVLQTQVDSMQALAAQVKAAGPAEIGVFDLEIGSHSIILDAVDLDGGKAQVRDPYHGWAITIALNALTKRFSFPDRTIQAIQPQTEQP